MSSLLDNKYIESFVNCNVASWLSGSSIFRALATCSPTRNSGIMQSNFELMNWMLLVGCSSRVFEMESAMSEHIVFWYVGDWVEGTTQIGWWAWAGCGCTSSIEIKLKGSIRGQSEELARCYEISFFGKRLVARFKLPWNSRKDASTHQGRLCVWRVSASDAAGVQMWNPFGNSGLGAKCTFDEISISCRAWGQYLQRTVPVKRHSCFATSLFVPSSVIPMFRGYICRFLYHLFSFSRHDD